MAEKKTILHIITSLKIGGAETLLADFLEHPQAADFDHQVIYFYDGPNKARLQELGIACYQVKGLFCLYDPLFFMRLYRLIKKLKPDCIHSWLWSANVVARVVNLWLRIPLLNSFHLGADQDGWVRNALDRATEYIPARLVAVSEGVAQLLVTHLHISNQERLTVIKNGIDPDNIHTKSKKMSAARAALGLSDQQYIIGTVGRWIERKNYLFLLEVFAQLHQKDPTVVLLLIGKGEQKGLLYERARTLGISNYVKFIEGQPALGYYQLFDCFIQTSFKEGISIALLEAMSCRLPCILTEPSGVHEVIVHEYNGLLVPSYNAVEVCQAINRLKNEKQLAKALGGNAYATIKEQFNVETMINSYHKEYSQLINFNEKNR